MRFSCCSCCPSKARFFILSPFPSASKPEIWRNVNTYEEMCISGLVVQGKQGFLMRKKDACPVQSKVSIQVEVRNACTNQIIHPHTDTHTHTHTGQPCESHTLISWVHSHSPPFLLPSSFHSSFSSGLFLNVLCLSNHCLIVVLSSPFQITHTLNSGRH